MNACLTDTATITTVELPYQWRFSPWVLNVKEECVRDLAVAIMHQAILDARLLGSRKSLATNVRWVDGVAHKANTEEEAAIIKEETDDFLDWANSKQFTIICDSINAGKDCWTVESMRAKLGGLLTP
jgi:hypothetical protein